jgi:hypothetical protein
MLSAQVKEFAEKLDQLSLEDKQWLMQQLMQNLTQEINNSHISQDYQVNNTKINTVFNISPALSGSGYTDTAVNHDQIFVNALTQ